MFFLAENLWAKDKYFKPSQTLQTSFFVMVTRADKNNSTTKSDGRNRTHSESIFTQC